MAPAPPEPTATAAATTTVAMRELLWASDALYAAELDDAGVVLDANPGLRRVRPEGLRGAPITDLMAAGQRSALLRAVEAATEAWSAMTLTFLAATGEATDDRAVRLLRTDAGVLLVAEPARVDQDHLVEQILELNDELLTTQRVLGRRQRELERSRAEAEAATERAAQLEAITLVGLARPDDAFGDVLGMARGILRCNGAALSLVGDGGRIEVQATSGLGSSAHRPLAEAIVAAGQAQGDGAFAGVPLRLNGTVVGLLQIQIDGGAQPDTLRLLEAVGERAALVIGHTQLLERERSISEVLQRSLLPQGLPEVPGAELAAHYRPQAHELHLGGDFYDATLLPDGRLSLAIGDVAGKGLPAAVLMGRLRSSLRAYVLDGRSPGEVLDRLDRLVAEADDFATALHLVLDVETGEGRAASAGHPSAVLRDAEGRAAFADTPPTVPLGLGRSGRRETPVALPPGGSLLLYTDGLFERRGTDPDDRFEALRVACETAPRPLEALAGHLIRVMGDQGFTDDVAMLALRRADDAGS